MVSVIVPVYNMEKKLKRCVKSILNQSYHELEVILVNDGSTDKSVQICYEMEKLDERVTVIDKKNGGVSTARNAGLERASGEWIMFVDPDDFLKSDIIKKLLDFQNNADIIACCCSSDRLPDSDSDIVLSDSAEDVHFFDTNCIFSDNEEMMPGFQSLNKRELLMQLISRRYGSETERITAIGVPWGKLYRRSFLQENRLKFDATLIRMQDNIFNMFAFDKTEKIIYIDYPGYVYNVGHITNYSRKFDKRVIEYFPKIINYRIDYCQEKGYLNDNDIVNCMDGEIIKFSNMMLTKYFLHIENKASANQKKRDIQKFFSSDVYKRSFHNSNAFGVYASHKLRISMINHNMVGLLVLFETILQKGKRIYAKK